ncbi:hypothetical protein ACFMQL_31455 [Nonomuraea fastidiosa]|jgi:hypothetical protein|uniref:hypothetical protein n=1 Tax=Nonomuraea TaxID=83681 RepID=UPI003244CFD7
MGLYAVEFTAFMPMNARPVTYFPFSGGVALQAVSLAWKGGLTWLDPLYRDLIKGASPCSVGEFSAGRRFASMADDPRRRVRHRRAGRPVEPPARTG